MGSPGWEGQAEPKDKGTDAGKASPRTSPRLWMNWEGFSVFKVLLDSLELMILSKLQEVVKDREDGALQAMRSHSRTWQRLNNNNNATYNFEQTERTHGASIFFRKDKMSMKKKRKCLWIESKKFTSLIWTVRGSVCMCLVYEMPTATLLTKLKTGINPNVHQLKCLNKFKDISQRNAHVWF